ncbi:MAG: SOS response-associated peptidase [Candidatus Saccharibacteria bacterium]
MTERYALFEIDKLRDRFQLPSGVPKGVKASYNISPTQVAPIVLIKDGVRAMERMKWGFIPHRAKDANSVFRYKTFMARSEDAFDKTTWQHAIRFSRCLIPANGFYEWQKTDDGKLAYFIRPKDQNVFALAGVYSSWRDPDGVEWGTFAVVTTMANKEMSVLSNRMPVILHPEDEATWLDPMIDDANTLYDLMRPYYSSQVLEIRPIGPDVDNKKIDGPQVIE